MKVHIAAVAFIPLVTLVGLHSTVHARTQDKPTRSVRDGIYTADQSKRGSALYADNCSPCHGPELQGGEMAPGLCSADFIAGWNDLTVGDLFDRIRISMPQNAPGSLTREQNADILSFMLSCSKYPTGSAELPTQSEVLKQIKFEPPAQP